MVHILAYGTSLCGLPGTPSEWPKGQSFVSITVVQSELCLEMGGPEEMDYCPDCLSYLREIVDG